MNERYEKNVKKIEKREKRRKTLRQRYDTVLMCRCVSQHLLLRELEG